MKRPIVALVLSALILPGLGQLYLGRRIKGVVMIMVINLLLLVGLFFVMKISNPVIAAYLGGTALTPALILETVQPFATWAKLLLAAFFAVWGYSLVDLASAFREDSTTPRSFE